MQIETLIKMANQIGDFFESHPDKVQSQEDIANHINRFWTKDMRVQLAQHNLAKQGEGLHLQVAAAISSYLQI